MTGSKPALLTDFKSVRPLHETQQQESLDWLLHAYSKARQKKYGVVEKLDRVEKLLSRYGCAPPRILKRGHEIADYCHRDWQKMEVFRLEENPHGVTLGPRMELFSKGALRAFRELYSDPHHPTPSEILHVTCTGYASPSPVQVFAESRGWSATVLTPVYHSGCYAAVPAVRIAMGSLPRKDAIDIVHTEICSLHLDPLHQEPEQLVVHSLFADGFIRYSVREYHPSVPGFRVLAIAERMVPNTGHEMQWHLAPYAFRMVLSRQVPELLAASVEPFLDRLAAQAGLVRENLGNGLFALHPGGPRILEILQDRLRLKQDQIAHSRQVLAQFGNMSSATLPTLWAQILHDPKVPNGTLVPSLAFGPGLTLAGILLQKVGT